MYEIYSEIWKWMYFNFVNSMIIWSYGGWFSSDILYIYYNIDFVGWLDTFGKFLI